MRIVSLLGSATEIVYELGLGDQLVGISHECDHPAEALRLPRLSRARFDATGLTSGEVDAAVRRTMQEFGSVYEVDRQLLARLAPDLVLTQAVCEVCAVPTGSVEQAVADLDGEVRVASLDAHTLDDIFKTMEEVGAAAGNLNSGTAAASRLRRRLADVAGVLASEERPSVLLLEWLDPPFAPGHWVPQMVDAAGGHNLLGKGGERSTTLSWDEITGLDPDFLLIEPCGYDLDEAAADAARLGDRLKAVAPRAIESGKSWVLHSAWFSRSGPRVVDGVEALARILHPSSFPDPPSPATARRWIPGEHV